MAKMFYTAAEAANKLGKSVEDVRRMVRDGRLREFMDNGPVYRVEDITKMVEEAAPAAAPPGAGDAVDLELVEEPAGTSKEDTVITSAGISVFDDEDLQIEADPAAQTHIAPSVEDQISLEGSGSGSGLLDLTREADDTSLGAELLEEIYPTGGEVGESADAASGTGAAEQAAAAEPAVGMMSVPAVIEAADPTAAAFIGIAVVGLLTVAFLTVVVGAISRDIWPGYLQSLAEGSGVYILGGVLLLLAVVGGVVGMVVGKSTSAPRR